MRETKIIMAAVIASLILPVSVFAQGQQNQQGSGQGGQQDGQHQRPSPEQMVEHLMNKFDANKDGELSQDELTKALEELRKNRPQGPNGAGKGDGSTGSSQGVQVGHSGKTAGSGGQQGTGHGDKQGTAQGGQTGQHQGPPPADKVATKMIEDFSSDKKGLKQDELAKALEDLHAKRTQQQGGQGQQGHGGNKEFSTGGSNSQL